MLIKDSNKPKLTIIVSIFLMIVIVCVIIVNDRKEQSNYDHMEALNKEAQVIRKSLSDLEQELDQKTSNFSYQFENTKIAVGFILSSSVDLEQIFAYQEIYGFEPIIILDASQSENILEAIVESAVEYNYKFAWLIPELKDDSLEKMNILNRLLKSKKRNMISTLLLEKKDATQEVLKSMYNSGFNDVLYGAKEPDYEVTDYGLVHWNYMRLSSDEDDFSKRLTILLENKEPSMYVIDLKSKELSSDKIQQQLDVLDNYVEKSRMSFVSAQEISEEIRENDASSMKNYIAYEKRKKEIEKEIVKLRQDIRDIYK